jgi:DNA mismatch repair protein MutS2
LPSLPASVSWKIVSTARNDVNPENIRADKLLDDIRKERNRAGREREKIEKARKRNEELNRELEQRLETIEDERRKVIAEARAEAELEVAVLRRNLDSLKSQLKKARQPLEALKKVEEKVEKIAEKVEEPVVRKVKEERRPAGVLKLGDKVTVSTLNADGVVTALGESDAEVQVGSLRIRAKLSELRRKQSIIESLPKEAPKTAETTTVQRASSKLSSPGLELDLRGQISEDALDKLDRYLEQAYLSGLPFVRIIHGKGTGVLRQVVRDALRQTRT